MLKASEIQKITLRWPRFVDAAGRSHGIKKRGSYIFRAVSSRPKENIRDPQRANDIEFPYVYNAHRAAAEAWTLLQTKLSESSSRRKNHATIIRTTI